MYQGESGQRGQGWGVERREMEWLEEGHSRQREQQFKGTEMRKTVQWGVTWGLLKHSMRGEDGGR